MQQNQLFSLHHAEDCQALALLGLLLLLYSAGVLQAAAADDWPQWRGPHRDGISAEKTWRWDWSIDEPKRLWKTAIGIGYTAPVIRMNRVYLVGNAKDTTDTLFCLNAETGEELWHFSYPCKAFSAQHEGGPAATPAIDRDYIYTVSKAGDVFCLEAGTGRKKWSRHFPPPAKIPGGAGNMNAGYGYSASPLVDEKAIYLNLGRGYALDKRTGKTLWKSREMAEAFSSPMSINLAGTPAVVLWNRDGLFFFRKRDGLQLDHFQDEWYKAANAATPVIQGNELILICNDGLDQFEYGPNHHFKRTSHRPEFANELVTPLLFEGYLYLTNQRSGKIECMEVATGKIMWGQGGFGGNATMCIAGDKLLILSEKGELVVADASPKSFHSWGRTQAIGAPSWTTPVLANNKIYCRNTAGEVVCLDVRQPLAR